MNPMILLGLGAVALMAMGGKKKAAPKDEPEDDSGFGQMKPMVSQKVGRKTSVTAALPPLNYQSIALGQAGTSQAKACHLQGMTDLNEITMCIAKKLFPNWNWTQRSGWQNDAWAHMMNVSRMEMGLQPIIPEGN